MWGVRWVQAQPVKDKKQEVLRSIGERHTGGCERRHEGGGGDETKGPLSPWELPSMARANLHAVEHVCLVQVCLVQICVQCVWVSVFLCLCLCLCACVSLRACVPACLSACWDACR
jgi:hypothetical protein